MNMKCTVCLEGYSILIHSRITASNRGREDFEKDWRIFKKIRDTENLR